MYRHIQRVAPEAFFSIYHLIEAHSPFFCFLFCLTGHLYQSIQSRCLKMKACSHNSLSSYHIPLVTATAIRHLHLGYAVRPPIFMSLYGLTLLAALLTFHALPPRHPMAPYHGTMNAQSTQSKPVHLWTNHFLFEHHTSPPEIKRMPSGNKSPVRGWSPTYNTFPEPVRSDGDDNDNNTRPSTADSSLLTSSSSSASVLFASWADMEAQEKKETFWGTFGNMIAASCGVVGLLLLLLLCSRLLR